MQGLGQVQRQESPRRQSVSGYEEAYKGLTTFLCYRESSHKEHHSGKKLLPLQRRSLEVKNSIKEEKTSIKMQQTNYKSGFWNAEDQRNKTTQLQAFSTQQQVQRGNKDGEVYRRRHQLMAGKGEQGQGTHTGSQGSTMGYRMTQYPLTCPMTSFFS